MKRKQILYLAPIPYDQIRARPQWLSAHLARLGHSVLYLNPPTLSASVTWGPDDPRISRDIDEGGATLTRIIFPRGLKLGSMKTKLPLEARFQRDWFEKLINAKSINKNEAAVIIANPRLWWPIVEQSGLANIYYDCQDHWRVLSGAMPKNEFEAIEKSMAQKCKTVFVTTPILKEHILSLHAGARIHIVPNAIDWEALTATAGVASKSARKVVGLVGSIEHEWVNRELIRDAAAACPEYDFTLVGPLRDPSPAKALLGGLPNVRLVGRVPYDEVGRWIQSFDLGIIPFNDGELALSTEPIKAYEYMAFGKPVLAHNLPEVEKFGDLATVTYRDEDFIAAIRRLLEHDDPGLVEKRIALAKGNSWRSRAAMISEIISEPGK